MSRNLRAALIVAAILGGLLWFGIHVAGENAKMTAPAAGTVLKSEFVADSESSSLDETRIDYSFEVNGRSVRASDSLPGDKTADYPPGAKLKLCYDPEEPVSSRITTGAPCG